MLASGLKVQLRAGFAIWVSGLDCCKDEGSGLPG